MGHSHSEKNESLPKIIVCILISCVFMVAEFLVGHKYNSLALVSDSGHMLTDVLSLVVLLVGTMVARLKPTEKLSFGYARIQILGGLFNGALLFIASIGIIIRAFELLHNPHETSFAAILVMGTSGLFVNILVFFILHSMGTHHLSVRGAYLHALSDLLASLTAILAGIIIYYTGNSSVDPILSILISLIIFWTGISFFRDTISILMEGTPKNLNLAAVRELILSSSADIKSIDTFHSWSITSNKHCLILKLKISGKKEFDSHDLKKELREKFSFSDIFIELVHD